MTRVRIVALLAVVGALAAMPTTASASSTTSMIAKVNAFRAAHGLGPVQVSRSLEHSAHAYAGLMMHEGYFGHAATIHASRRFRTLGECIEIHRWPSPMVGFTARDWENSPEHRALLLSPVFKFAGAGYVVGSFHGAKQTIWVLHLGRH
jgi:uncharacterized protein YkwD